MKIGKKKGKECKDNTICSKNTTNVMIMINQSGKKIKNLTRKWKPLVKMVSFH